MKICGKCQRQFTEDEMFCPECGIKLQLLEQSSVEECKTPELTAVSNNRKFHFVKEKIYGVKIDTVVTVEGRRITMDQEKSCLLFFKWGKVHVDLDVCEINDVARKKGISGAGLLISVILFFVAISANWVGKLLFLISLFTVRDSYLYIYFKNGYIKIPKDNINSSIADEGSMDDLVDYIQQHNPDAVKIEGSN